MKILHVITSLRIGGAEKLMVDLLPRLRDLNHEVDLCIFDGVRTPFYQVLEERGIHIFPLQRGGSVYDPRNILSLIRIMKDYDIVHTHNTACQLYSAVAHLFSSRPTLFTTEHNTTNRRRGRWYLKPGDLWMYKQYKKIICISNQARENLINYIGDSQKIVTIYNGIDLSIYKSANSQNKGSNAKKIVTMVAAFRAQKDHKTLIEAFNLLPDDYLLQLIGDGELRTETEDFVKQFSSANRILFMGNRHDVPKLLADSDVVVLSSHYEGFGLSIVEGMAAKKPCIVSDVEGLREVVSGAGLLFPHQNAKSLALLICKCCTDKAYADSVGLHCYERAQTFDICKMVEQYSALYSSL